MKSQEIKPTPAVPLERIVMQILHNTILPTIPLSDINLDTNFITDLGADSLELVECIMELEEATDLEIPDRDCANWSTVKDVVSYLADKVVVA